VALDVRAEPDVQRIAHVQHRGAVLGDERAVEHHGGCGQCREGLAAELREQRLARGERVVW
jgi:hypothetical protein